MTAIDSPVREGAVFAADSRSIEFCLESTHRPEFDVTPEYMKDGLCLLFIDEEPPVLDIVAERRQTAHPHALLFRRGDFVADPFTGHLPLKLGEGKKDIEGQPSHARGGVELLRDRYEGDTARVEGFHDLGEVKQRARQTVDLINDNHVHLGVGDIGEKPLQGRAVQCPP